MACSAHDQRPSACAHSAWPRAMGAFVQGWATRVGYAAHLLAHGIVTCTSQLRPATSHNSMTGMRACMGWSTLSLDAQSPFRFFCPEDLCYKVHS